MADLNGGILVRFESWCARDPRRPAVVGADGTCSYARLARRAADATHRLRSSGVGPEDLVGLVAERSAGFVAMVLGVLGAGAAYVPIEPTTPPERAAAMCDNGRVATLFAQARHRAFADRLAALAATPTVVTAAADERPAAPALVRDPDGLAYVIFTSGSTGTPKGAMVVDRGMDNHLQAKITDLALTPGDVVGLTAPLSFDISVWQALAPLAAGACVAVAAPGDLAEPGALAAWIDRHRVRVLEIVPSFLAVVLDEIEHDRRVRDRFAALRTLIATGEALPGPLARRWLRAFPGTVLMNAYGPTECSDDVTHHVVTAEECADGRGPAIGREIRNTRVRVVDPGGRECPAGVEGELYVGGDGVGRGYRGDPVRTAVAFVPDFLGGAPGGRLYRTGDRAVRGADGAIGFSGRWDRQVKVRGHRVELGDVEAQLLAVPGVRAAACVADGGVLRAFVTLTRGTPADGQTARIMDRLRTSAPSYLVPHEVRVIERMPTGATGKIDLRALTEPPPAPHAAPAGRTGSGDGLDAARALVAELVGLPDVAPDEDFFAAGGDSLLAMRLIALARERFAAEAALGDFLDDPTPRGLLAALRTAPDGPPAPGSPATAALSAGQERLWFVEQLTRGRGPQLIRLAVALHGLVDEAALRHALRAVVMRHEPLRGVVATDGGIPFLRLSPDAEIVLETGTGAADAAPTDFLPRAALSVDTPRPPLMAARLTRVGPEHHVLGLVLHHLVADGVSLGILADEIRFYYERHQAGITAIRPPRWSYSGYVEAERAWLDGAEGTAAADYWTTHLAGAPALLDLPLDRPRPDRPAYATASVVRSLGPAGTRRVVARCRRLGGTPVMAVTAAFFTTLCEATGGEEIVIGVDAANRSWPGGDALLGTFVNQLPVRLVRPARSTFQNVLEMVRERSLAAYRNERLPYHRIVAATNPPRHPGRPPLFQVKITQQGAWSAGLTLPGCTAVPLEIAEPAMDLDLMLDVSQSAAGLRLELLYRPELMNRSTVAAWLDATVAALLGGVAAPQTAGAEIDEPDAIEQRT